MQRACGVTRRALCSRARLVRNSNNFPNLAPRSIARPTNVGNIQSSRWYHSSNVLFSASDDQDKDVGSGEEEEEIDPVEAAAEAARVARRIKIIDEGDRYNREKEAYEAEMSALRKKYRQETHRKKVEKENMLGQRDAKRRALEEVRRKQKEEAYDRWKTQRTDLELNAIELLPTPEEKRAQQEQNRIDKLRRRKLTAAKLLQEQEFQERLKEQMVSYLAKEAKGWLSAEDIEDEAAFNEKLQAKLLDIQPITATFSPALPKHHFKDAEKWASAEETYNDFMYYLKIEEEEEERQANRNKMYEGQPLHSGDAADSEDAAPSSSSSSSSS